MIIAAALEIAAAASGGTIPARAWARASAASTSVQRATKASSPNAARIATVPNMSPNRLDDRTPMVIDVESSWLRLLRSEGRPGLVGVALQRGETRLVGHLRALGDPVAEVDKGKTLPTALLDQPEDAPGAEALLAAARIIKGVDRRKPIIEPVEQRHRRERPVRIAEFGDRGADRAVFDHAAVIGVAHVGHVAVAVARLLIGGEQAELLGGGPAGDQPSGEAAIEVPHPARRACIGEPLDGDPHRHAGGALAAGGAVGEAMAAPEPGARQIVIERGGAAAGQFDDQFALGAAWDIRAGHRGGGEKLR